MFIELHTQEGKPVVINFDSIVAIQELDDERAKLSLIKEDTYPIITQESYEDIRRALHNEIVSVGHDESVERVVWRRNDNMNHTCSICGQTWTGYYETCPKCGNPDFMF